MCSAKRGDDVPYFPFFVDIGGKRCLIVGGGRIALHKIRKLLPFSPEIHVVSPEICGGIADISGLFIERRGFQPTDLDGAFFVIAATDRPEVNSEISRLCRSRGIPCNAVDNPADCSFYFPALAQRGDITVGVSTSGKSPLIAAGLRREAERLVTPELAEICALMGEIRPAVRERFPEEKRRAVAMKAALGFCMSLETIPDSGELLKFIDGLELKI